MALQHHLRTLTSPGHHRRQPLDFTDGPHALEHLTVVSGPHDHRAATCKSIPTNCRPAMPPLRASSPSRTAHKPCQASRWEVSHGSGGGPAPTSHQPGNRFPIKSCRIALRATPSSREATAVIDCRRLPGAGMAPMSKTTWFSYLQPGKIQIQGAKARWRIGRVRAAQGGFVIKALVCRCQRSRGIREQGH